MRTYEQALQLGTAQPHTPGAPGSHPVLRGTADMYVGMSELERERNDLDVAREHLLRSKELGEHTGLPQHPYRWCVAMARIREAEGDLDGGWPCSRRQSGCMCLTSTPMCVLSRR